MVGKQARRALAQAATVLLCACALTLLPACGGDGGGSGGASGGQANAAPASGGDSGATGAAFSAASSVSVPDVSGVSETIDVGPVNEGYVVASASSASRLKFQVTNGDQTYNYDLPNDGSPTIYPINMGDGSYLFRVMQNTEGNNYVELNSASADVALSNDLAPFLLPNMFCNYSGSSTCVSKAKDLVSSATNEGEAVATVCLFLTQAISYDNDKAAELSTTTGYVPNPDQTLSSGTGICFDYASLAAAMLRSQGLPTKIITGYVEPDSIYHAWIMVYIDGTWQTAQFSVNPNTWSRVDITFASTGGSSFVGEGVGYTDKYVY